MRRPGPRLVAPRVTEAPLTLSPWPINTPLLRAPDDAPWQRWFSALGTAVNGLLVSGGGGGGGQPLGPAPYLDLTEQVPPAPPDPAVAVARLYALDSSGYTQVEMKDSAGRGVRFAADNVVIGKVSEPAGVARGQGVYIAGAAGANVLVRLARANDIATMPAIGVALDAGASNAFIRVLHGGTIQGVNTAAFAEGVSLFVSTTTAGGFTTTLPDAPNYGQRVGFVTRSHATQGEILVVTTGVAAPPRLHAPTHAPGGSDPLLNAAWTNQANVFTANQTINGLLTVNGFGTHTFSASGAGANALSVRNTADGAGNYVSVGLIAGATTGGFYAFPQSWTTGGANLASGITFLAENAGGMSIQAAHPSGAIRFYTGGATERMTIAAAGGLTVTRPTGTVHALTVSHNVTGYIAVGGFHDNNAASAYAAFFHNYGSATGLFLSNGGAWVTTSDRRLKTDIRPLAVVDRLRQLQPRDFLWATHATSDRPGQRQFGFVAQEVDAVFPDLVTRAALPPGLPGAGVETLGLAYTGLIAPLVSGWQDHDRRLAALEARLNG